MMSATPTTDIERVLALEQRHSSGLFPLRPAVFVRGEGARLYDAQGAEYLDCAADRPRLFPPPGPERWEARCLEVLGDGMIGTLEGRLPPGDHTPTSISHQLAKLDDVLDALDAWPGGLGPDPTIGTISVAVALGYLDWRLPEEDWHAGRQTLSAWYAVFAARPSMRESAPHGEPA